MFATTQKKTDRVPGAQVGGGVGGGGLFCPVNSPKSLKIVNLHMKQREAAEP